jgi:hypothetical protein
VRRGNGAQRNDLAERSPSRPSGGEAYTGLLCAVPAFYRLFAFSFLSFSFSAIGRMYALNFFVNFNLEFFIYACRSFEMSLICFWKTNIIFVF